MSKPKASEIEQVWRDMTTAVDYYNQIPEDRQYQANLEQAYANFVELLSRKECVAIEAGVTQPLPPQ